MDLSTTYLGFVLPHPIIVGASPLADDIGDVRRLEDAGAAMIVMRSLFEEQIVAEQLGDEQHLHAHAQSHSEASTYFPELPEFALGPDEYLGHLHRIKSAVEIPVIASLNGTTAGWWLSYAKQMQEAGADALELNLYDLATDPAVSAADVERRHVEVVQAVKKTVTIPVAVKLSPYYTSLANFTRRIDRARANGLVLFNRFYQPDIDAEELEVVRRLGLSDSSELLLRLRWLAVLSGRVQASLCATGGVHDSMDVIKAAMAGAHATQMVAALFRNGFDHIRRVLDEVATWLEEHEYDSLRQMQGSMNLQHCPNPHAFERANYMHILQSRMVEGF